LYRGGYGDVWKGKYHNQDVAVKVIRTYSTDELQKIIHVGYWPRYTHTLHVLTILYVDVLQGSCDMEISSAPEYPAVDRGVNVRESVRDGIGVDDERKHRSIR